MSELDSLLKQAFAHADADRLAEAAAALEQVLRTQPDHAEALHELGMLHHRCGRHEQAVKLLRRAADLAPAVFRFRFNLALMLLRAGRKDDSLPHFQQSLDLATSARDLTMIDMVATALNEGGYSTGEIEAYRRALAIDPNSTNALDRLGTTLKDQGRLEEALAAFDRVLAINPTSGVTLSNRLLCLNYDDRFSPQEVFAEHERLTRPLVPSPPPARPARQPNSDGRIRIAYLSSDFRQHSVAFFIWPILAKHDRTRFCVTCYSDVAKPDRVTAQMQRLTERWRPVCGMPDAQLARLIADDQIDILIDLAGHTDGNRMPLLARRVAPIQATYLGYPNTSGLGEVDYRITDGIADPPGQTESLHSERLVRLPESFFCYLTPTGYPDVTPPPAAAAGMVTFAVLTNFAKVRPHMMDVWGRLIAQTSRSRLLIQAKGLDDPPTRAAVIQFFAERGLGADRIEVRGWADFPQFLKQLSGVDILLDTFPFVGHTATCNVLWMGVTPVTLGGIAHRSRMGASILTNLGLLELIAQTDDDYIRIARELAGDIPRLAELRLGMRERMALSPFMDPQRFTRNLEAAYEQMLELR